MNHRIPYVAVRHGVILATGETPAAAAAAAAARVSRCDVLLPSRAQCRMLPRIAGRRLPADTEAQLLEAIHTDISRVLAAYDVADPGYDHIHEPVLLEYRDIDLERLSPEAYDALDARRDLVADELDELDALANQGDLFAAAPA